MIEIENLKLDQLHQWHPETVVGDWSEMGLASLFSQLYRPEALFCPESRSWYVYGTSVWQKDEGGILAAEKVKDFARLMVAYCASIQNDDARTAYLRFVNRMGDRRVRTRILNDAMGMLRVPAASMDGNPWLINCLNGTYDLQSHSFKKADWNDFLTMQTDFYYDGAAHCERFEQFIDEVTEGDTLKADYLQRALGYSLLGNASEECMFILHGKTTRNGKSTLLHVIERMLGDYSRVAPVALICYGSRKSSSNAEGASPTLAALKGRRFVTMSESNEYGKLDEEKVKLFTGGEAISARALYQSTVTFLPQFTLWLSCNDLPAVSDRSLFASERIRVIEFNRHFSQQEQNKHLKNELTSKKAMSGIFNWLVEGFQKYQKNGLAAPSSVVSATRRYEADNDFIDLFLKSCCTRDDATNTKAKDVYQAYIRWADAEGAYPLTARKFYAELQRHTEFFYRKAVSNGQTTFFGLKVNSLSSTLDL